ncbi:hypothetical protein [Planktothrix phage Pra-JY27]|nr:hypothetical protein [Planktothrix phage Pag-Yong1]WEV89192.1 hypothetical protein [Synechococcus phage MinM2]
MADDVNPRTAALARQVNSMAMRPRLRDAGISVQEARQMLRSPEGIARLERAFEPPPPATRSGGGGGGGGQPPARTTSATPEPRGGRAVAPRASTEVAPSRVVPEGRAEPRFVPNTYRDPALPPPASSAAPQARAATGRGVGTASRFLGPAGVALSPILDARSLNDGETEALEATMTPDQLATRRRAQAEARARAEEPPLPDPPPPAPPARQPARPPSRAVRGDGARPRREMSADDLNDLSLRMARGEKGPPAPREAGAARNIGRAMEEARGTSGYAKGGAVKRERYASGGMIGRDGCAKRGRTKGRFI